MVRNKIPIRIAEGTLIIIFIIVIGFTFLDFGVDRAAVVDDYLQTKRYSSNMKNFTTTVDTYKEVMDARIESDKVALEEGNMDFDGNLLYLFPFKSSSTTWYFSYDMGVEPYTKDTPWHTGTDWRPTQTYSSDSDCEKDLIVAPCDGEATFVGGTYNEVYVEDGHYKFRLLHLLKFYDSYEKGKTYTVKKGDPLGYIGHTGAGAVGNTHLHFACQIIGTSNALSHQVNPISAGKFDMQGAVVIAYNVDAGNNVKAHSDYNNRPPLTLSYLDNLYNCVSYTFKANSSAGADVYKAVYTSDGNGEFNYMYDSSYYDYIPYSTFKSWYPKGVFD